MFNPQIKWKNGFNVKLIDNILNFTYYICFSPIAFTLYFNIFKDRSISFLNKILTNTSCLAFEYSIGQWIIDSLMLRYLQRTPFEKMFPIHIYTNMVEG